MSFSVRLTGVPGPDVEVGGVSLVPFIPEAAFQAFQAQSGLSALMQEWVGLVSRLPVGGAIPARLLHVPKIQASSTFINLPLSWPDLQAHWLVLVKLARLDARVRPPLARLGIVPAELSGAGAVLGTGKAQAKEDPVTSAVSPAFAYAALFEKGGFFRDHNQGCLRTSPTLAGASTWSTPGEVIRAVTRGAPGFRKEHPFSVVEVELAVRRLAPGESGAADIMAGIEQAALERVLREAGLLQDRDILQKMRKHHPEWFTDEATGQSVRSPGRL